MRVGRGNEHSIDRDSGHGGSLLFGGIDEIAWHHAGIHHTKDKAGRAVIKGQSTRG